MSAIYKLSECLFPGNLFRIITVYFSPKMLFEEPVAEKFIGA